MEKAYKRRDKVYEEIIKGFEAYIKKDTISVYSLAETQKLEKEIQKGLKQFIKYWGSFWD